MKRNKYQAQFALIIRSFFKIIFTWKICRHKIDKTQITIQPKDNNETERWLICYCATCYSTTNERIMVTCRFCREEVLGEWDATAFRFFSMPKEIEFFKKLTAKDINEGGAKRATAKLINCIQARHRIIKPTNLTNKDKRLC